MARGVRLSDDEAWAALEAAHTGVLTSLRRDGWPISLPVWFVVLDRRIYVSGPAHTKKFARVRHDPRVSFLVESGERWVDLLGVHVTGTARIASSCAARSPSSSRSPAPCARNAAFRASGRSKDPTWSAR